MRLALAFAGLALLAEPAMAAPHIGRIRAQLFYEATGRLSDDITPPAEFHGWNTIIGEGSAEEQANDLLISVEVIGDGGQENLSVPIRIVARGRGGHVLGQRAAPNRLLSQQGRVWTGLWLNDVGCAGAIDIVATIGASSRRTRVTLDCGE